MEEGHTGVSYVGTFGQMGCREGKGNIVSRESVISLRPIEDMFREAVAGKSQRDKV